MNRRKFNDTTALILPMFGLPAKEYEKCGLLSAYVNDENKMFPEPCTVLLFRADESYGEMQSDLVTLLDDLVADVYTYGPELVCIALNIPEELQDDYWLIRDGKYSRLSDLYRQKVSDKVYTKLGYEMKRLPLMIAEKSPMVKKKVEEMFGDIDLDYAEEVWPLFSYENELLTNSIIDSYK